MRAQTISKTVAVPLLILLAASCAKRDEGRAAGEGSRPAAPTTPPSGVVADSGPVFVEIKTSEKTAASIDMRLGTVANTMAFDRTQLSVPRGAAVRITLKNNATLSTLPHNWVLVKPGTEARVAAAGLKLGDSAGYVDLRDDSVLAATPLAKPGETVSVLFTAPEAGDYSYICTVPGHYLMMKGVLTVTP